MKIFRVAIDLSSTKSGVAVGYDTWTNTFVVDTTESKTWDEYMWIWNCSLNDIMPELHPSGYDKLLLGIEVSNFSNPKLTQKFSTLAGIIMMWFRKWWPASLEMETKTFNSNQWQMMIGCKPSDEREIRKAKARMWAKKMSVMLNVDNYSQDEIDAWCILKNLDNLNSTDEIKEITKQKKKTQEQIKKEKYRKMISIQQKILVLQEELKNLSEEKNSRRIKTVLNKLDQLKGELNEVK